MCVKMKEHRDTVCLETVLTVLFSTEENFRPSNRNRYLEQCFLGDIFDVETAKFTDSDFFIICR